MNFLDVSVGPGDTVTCRALMRAFALLLLSLSLLSASAYAQEEPIVADRPGLADGSSTVPRGVAQLETGLTLEDADDDLLVLPLLVRYGLSDRFELRLETGFAEGDLGPFAAGFKLRLREGAVPLSLMAIVSPPSGGGTLGSDAFEGEARLVSDIDLGGEFGLTPNVGVALVEGGDATAVFAASLERELGRVFPFIDFEARIGGGDTAMIADGGVAWVVRPDTQLDVSAGVDVTGELYPEWFLAVGYSRRF